MRVFLPLTFCLLTVLSIHVSAQIGDPGTVWSFCRPGSTNQCDAGLHCAPYTPEQDYCIPNYLDLTGGPGNLHQVDGSYSGVCLSGNKCNYGLSCVIFGDGTQKICIPGEGFSYLTGGYLGPCRTSGTPCDSPFTCQSDLCLTDSGTGGYTGGWTGGSDGRTQCSTNNPCFSSDQQCMSGYCVDVDYTQSNSFCYPSCLGSQICYNNYCRSPRPTRSCTQLCRSDLGELCDKEWGVCRVATAPVCNNCTTGQCVSSLFPGNKPQCWQNPFSETGDFTSCVTNAECGGVTRNGICRQGKCIVCGQFCQSVLADGSGLNEQQKDYLVTLLSQIGSSLDDISSITDLTVSGIGTNGQVFFHSGAITRFDGTSSWANQIQQLAFNSANSIAQLSVGAFNVPRLVVSAPSSQLLVNSGASFDANSVEIAANNALSLALAGGTSSARSVASFSSMALNGAFNAWGDSSSSVHFPQPGSTFTVGDGAQINLGGGVALRGWASNAPIRIGNSIASAMTAAATASILYGETFLHSGPVLNGGNDGSIGGSGKRASNKRSSSKVSSDNTTTTTADPAIFNVGGTFIYDGPVFEPTLQLQQGASVTMSAVSTLLAGDLKFITDSNSDLGIVNGSTISRLIIKAGSLRTAGDNISFGKIQNCPSGAKITFQLTGSNQKSDALKNGITIMSYAGLTTSERAAFQCALEVCDDDGCTTLQNPNMNVNGRRRLFADNTNAAFGATKLTAGGKVGTSDGGTGINQGGDNGTGVNSATSVSTPAGIVAAVILAAVMML